MSDYVCSVCNTEAFYDGRCGDGPILMCNCDKGEWINDGRGGYYDNPTGAEPIKKENSSASERERRYWENDRR